MDFFKYHINSAILLLTLGSFLAWAGPHIEVVALFEGKAMLLIDSQRLLVAEGETTEQGVKLISASAKKAVIEVDGVQRDYTLGGLVVSSPSASSQDKQKFLVYRDADNLFRVTGAINGFPVNMLVDTGASVVAINSIDAKRFGINYKLDGQVTSVSTASGVEEAYIVTLNRVTVSGVTLNNIQGVVIEGSSPDIPLLGMSFLSRFDIVNDGQVMTLTRKF